ncbi:ubiquitin carboxyl-terminal hydrolase 3-like [Anneissia japonica]|uniref:ubiquitin carboxyl-terminal hydrolase 3-like n=1 Tax=Anneissia japonica TaxID=1529436 RepID=UPI00142582EE|nr:ubiquitin carboxyl-terminal hydrolase 3-like [Anneissia japonica]XP_033108811.1 ubiquitin carboxyl-terminal hydrolase 3-like [Anneissia japonica]XP_033108812.1 ubiquitin carboxyl-terminal hydrolase 3-like [Anneissia japonica]
MECPHLLENVKGYEIVCNKKIKNENVQNWTCSVCRSNKSPWMCVTCCLVGCGRYVNGHSKNHCEDSTHPVCISCDNYSVFCYKCDEFVVNDTKTGGIQQIRVYLQEINSALHDRKVKRGAESSEENQPPRKKNSSNSVKAKFPGLRNLGNTCFMNAVLQSLSNIQDFCGYFKQLPAVELRSGKSAGKRVYNTRNLKQDDLSLAEEIRKTLCSLWRSGEMAISPEELFTIMSKLFPRFRGYQQQDAHEFMRYLLDRLHTELQGAPCPSNHWKPSNGKSTIVTLIFGGLLLSEVVCLKCSSVFKKIDPFLDLSIDIPVKFRSRSSKSKEGSTVCRLEDCIQSFTEKEELADSEHYMCTECKKRRPSTKKFWLRCLPNVLCLHLKRFHWNSYLRSKIDTYVRFPVRNLDINSFVLHNNEDDNENFKPGLYDLVAVVVHQGSGAGTGHYIAYALHEGQWYCFNDSTVTCVDESTILKCKAYLLFYASHTPVEKDSFVMAERLQKEFNAS